MAEIAEIVVFERDFEAGMLESEAERNAKGEGKLIKPWMHVVHQIGETLTFGLRLASLQGEEHCCGKVQCCRKYGHVEGPVQVVVAWVLQPRAGIMHDGKDEPTEKSSQGCDTEQS